MAETTAAALLASDCILATYDHIACPSFPLESFGAIVEYTHQHQLPQLPSVDAAKRSAISGRSTPSRPAMPCLAVDCCLQILLAGQQLLRHCSTLALCPWKSCLLYVMHTSCCIRFMSTLTRWESAARKYYNSPPHDDPISLRMRTRS